MALIKEAGDWRYLLLVLRWALLQKGKYGGCRNHWNDYFGDAKADWARSITYNNYILYL